MIAGDEVGAEFGRELAPGRNEARRVDVGAVEHVTADEDDVGAELAELGDDSGDEVAALDVAEMRVGDEGGDASAPGGGKAGEFHGDALDTESGGVRKAVERGENAKLKKKTAIPDWLKGRPKTIVIAIAIHARHAAANAKFTKPSQMLARR